MKRTIACIAIVIALLPTVASAAYYSLLLGNRSVNMLQKGEQYSTTLHPPTGYVLREIRTAGRFAGNLGVGIWRCLGDYCYVAVWDFIENPANQFEKGEGMNFGSKNYGSAGLYDAREITAVVMSAEFYSATLNGVMTEPLVKDITIAIFSIGFVGFSARKLVDISLTAWKDNQVAATNIPMASESSLIDARTGNDDVDDEYVRPNSY